MHPNQRNLGSESHGDKELLTMFREKVRSRGARGMIGLKRAFKIMDDNDSKSLDFQEFFKAVNDYRIRIN